MDFDEAIKAHVAWKMRLSAYISHPDGSLAPEKIRPDSQCDLGHWVHGEGATFANVPEYGTLRDQHAKFHLAAAEIVRRANAGESVKAQTELGSHSDFARASSGVVSALMAIRRKV